MKTTLIASTLSLLSLSSIALAAPAPATAPAPVGVKWDILNMQLAINARGTEADFYFSIAVPGQKPVSCSAIAVSTKAGVSATTQTATGKCGEFTVTSGWSNQFGDKNAFRVFAIKNAKYISYPGYTDNELFSTFRAKPIPKKTFDVYNL